MLVETSIPYGYVGVADRAVVIESQGQVVSFDLTNIPITGSLTLRKLGAAGPLAGAEFTLYNANGVIVKQGTTGAHGTLSFTGIPYGNYVLKETAAPAGYALLTTSWNVVIDSQGKVVNIGNISNTPITGSLTLRKVTATGTPLAGVEFTLFAQDGITKVRKGTTASDGTLSFTGIPYGNYILKETKALAGYELLGTTWNVVIDYQGKVVNIGAVLNTLIPTPTPEVGGETATPPPAPTPSPEVAGETTTLPTTGVPITYLFGIGGILLILGGIVLVVLKKSKKEDF